MIYLIIKILRYDYNMIITFSLLTLFLLIFSFIMLDANFSEYRAILDYRTKLSDSEFYKLKHQTHQMFEDYVHGIITSKQYSDFLKSFDFDIDLQPGLNTTLEGFATYMDITLPDDGPYDDLKADIYCRKKFKYHKRDCEKAIRAYYKNKNIINPKNKLPYEITVKY